MTIEEIKDQIAKENKWDDWGEMLFYEGTLSIEDRWSEVCREYARECVKASLEKAAENATAYIPFEGEPPSVAKGSIIDHTNIVML